MAEHKRDDEISELLLKWEESWERGVDISAKTLCPDRPDLIDALQRKIEALKEMSWASTDEEPPDDIDQLPETLANRYQLEEIIASGGFGQVWRALDRELQRHVAVKIPQNRNSRTSTAFIDEARKLARLKHPGIVTVHDVGREDGHAFIVSDLIEGADLKQSIERSSPSIQEALRIVTEAADALHFAHQQGFVHGDVKPANLLIDAKGRVFVADFGVARSIDGPADAGDTYGTLPYMAPEQLAGEHHLIDGRTDVYALGVVLHELITGEMPFNAATPQGLREKILFVRPTPLRHINQTLPLELETICLKCLAKHPAERFQSAHDLAGALRQLPKVLASRRTRTVIRNSITGLALLAGFFSVLFVLNGRSEHPETLETSRSPSSSQVSLVDDGVLHFDGRTRIVTPVDQFMPVTLEVWARTQYRHEVCLIGSDIPGKFGIGLNLVDFFPTLEIVKGGVSAPRPLESQTSWFHFAGVFGEHSSALYINGKPVANGPASKLSGVTPYVIGNVGEQHFNQFFRGDIRSIRITKGERYTTEFVPEDVLQTDDATVLIYDASSFDGNHLLDKSGNGNHGVIQRLNIETISKESMNATSAARDAPVKFMKTAVAGFADGGAFNFDGQTRILTPLERFAPVTLEAWIHADHNGYIIGSDIPHQWGVGFMLENGKVLVEYLDGSFVSDRPYNPTAWCHVAVVFSDDATVIYADGKEIGRGPPTRSEGGTPFVVGSVGEISPLLLLIGKIRSLRITRGVRYEADFMPPDELRTDENTQLLYDADQVKGSVVIDQSGNGNDGMIQKLVARSESSD